MPIATRPDPISASAIAGGVLLDPVKGSGFSTGAFVVGDDDGPVGAATTVVVDVEPKPVTGVVAVLVVDLAVVGVIGGTEVVGATVVVDSAVDDGLVLVDEVVDGEAVVAGATVLVVVSPGAQSATVCSACAEPPPSVDDHESFACTTCVPVPMLRATASVTSEVVNVKSRSTTVLPSTVTVS